MAKKRQTKVVLPLGHLKPKEDLLDSQIWSITRLARRGYGYKQIFSLLRGIPVSAVTDGERDRFGEIARSRGAGVNRYRMLQDQDAVDEVVQMIRGFPKENRVKPDARVLGAFVVQRQIQAKKAQARKRRKGR